MPGRAATLTATECEEWKLRPYMNPKTDKPINPFSKSGLYKKFVRMCNADPIAEGRAIQLPGQDQQVARVNAVTSPRKVNAVNMGVSPVKRIAHSMGTSTNRPEIHNAATSPKRTRTKDIAVGTHRPTFHHAATSPHKAHTTYSVPTEIKWQGRVLRAVPGLAAPVFIDAKTGDMFLAAKTIHSGSKKIMIFPLATISGMFTTDPNQISNAAYNSTKWLHRFFDITAGKPIDDRDALSSGSVTGLLHHGVPLAMFLHHAWKTCQSKANAFLEGVSNTAVYIPSEDTWRCYYVLNGAVLEQEFKINASRTGWHNIEQKGAPRTVSAAPGATLVGFKDLVTSASVAMWHVTRSAPDALLKTGRYIRGEVNHRYKMLALS